MCRFSSFYLLYLFIFVHLCLSVCLTVCLLVCPSLWHYLCVCVDQLMYLFSLAFSIQFPGTISFISHSLCHPPSPLSPSLVFRILQTVSTFRIPSQRSVYWAAAPRCDVNCVPLYPTSRTAALVCLVTDILESCLPSPPRRSKGKLHGVRWFCRDECHSSSVQWERQDDMA